MADIFISYAREDSEAAQRLAAALERERWSVFWDRQIPAGRRFSDVISEQLESAKCVIALWSAAASASDWVLDEAEEARKRGILAPALIEAVDPPMGFRRIHAADLIDWRGEATHAGFQRLIADIARYRTAEAGAIEAAPPRQVPRSSRRWIWVAFAAAAIVAFAVVGSIVLWNRAPTVEKPLSRAVEPDRPSAASVAPSPAPSETPARDAPTPKSTSAPSLARLVRLAMPGAQEIQRASWRARASAEIQQRLDRADTLVTSVLAEMDRQGADVGFEPAWQHVDMLRSAMSRRSIDIDMSGLSGAWNCRRLEVSKFGVLDRGVFSCSIRQTNCLLLSKTSGSQRFTGCLYPTGERHLAFVGGWAPFDSSGKRTAAGGPEGGFLSQTAANRLRMVVPGATDGFDVVVFDRQ